MTFLNYLYRTRNDEILKKNSVFFSPEVTSLKVFFQSNSNDVSGTKSRVFNALVKNKQIQNEVQKILNQPLGKAPNVLERNESFSIKGKYEALRFFNVFEKKQLNFW